MIIQAIHASQNTIERYVMSKKKVGITVAVVMVSAATIYVAFAFMLWNMAWIAETHPVMIGMRGAWLMLVMFATAFVFGMMKGSTEEGA